MRITKAGDIETNICCREGLRAIYAGEYDLAIEAFEQARALSPEIILAHTGLCLSYHETGRSEEMCDAFRRLSDVDSVGVARLLGLAIVHFEGRDYEAACRDMKRCMEIRPGGAFAHYVYGRVLLQIGRYEEGVSSLTCALELFPGFRVVRSLVSWVQSYLALDDEKRKRQVIQWRRRLHQTPFDLDLLDPPSKVPRREFHIVSGNEQGG